MERRVVKVGGSLLAIKEMIPKLKSWLLRNADMQNIVIVGGGQMADLVRRLDRNLSDEDSHKLACRAMSLTANIVFCSLKESVSCTDIDQLKQTQDPTVIFNACDWILGCEDVPASWNFTSDSIAAKLATEIDADELVLIKSRMGKLDEPGFVDACFAEQSSSVKAIRVCTLDE